MSESNRPRNIARVVRDRYGNPEWLPTTEQVLCAAAVHCTADEVRAERLTVDDFLLRRCGQLWDAARAVALPSPFTVAAYLDEGACADLHAWIAEWWFYCHPAGLTAHAALVRRESARRRRLHELSLEAARVGRAESDGRPRGIAGRYRDEL